MATSSIKRNFIIEGQDAEDFANSLDEAFKEREERKPYKFRGIELVGEEAKKAMREFFSKW